MFVQGTLVCEIYRWEYYHYFKWNAWVYSLQSLNVAGWNGVALPSNRLQRRGTLQRKWLKLGFLRAIVETNVIFGVGSVIITIYYVLRSF